MGGAMFSLRRLTSLKSCKSRPDRFIFEPLGIIVRRERRGEMVALREVTARRAQPIRLFFSFHAFDGDSYAKFLRHGQEIF